MTVKQQGVFKRYFIAIVSIGIAVVLTILIRSSFTLNPTPLILIAVIAAAWFGGKYPGLLACAIADLSIDYFFEDPPYVFSFAPVHIVRLLILCTVSLLVSSRKDAEDTLRTRARQQAAVARFGQEALSSTPINKLLPKATEMVAETLTVDLSAICEITPDRTKLCFTAGSGWSDDVSAHDFDFGSGNSLIDHVLERGEPVIIRDLRTDERFGSSDVLNQHDVRSGIAVTIRQRGKVYGLLGAFQNHTRHFSDDDVNFLQAMANIIAEATERLESENAINEQRIWLKTTLSSIGDGVIATDAGGNVIFMNPVAEGLTGWDEKAANGLPLERVFHIVNEETRKEVENPVTKVFKTGFIVGLANHTVLISKDGREIPIDDSAAPITDGGEIKGVVLVFSDVTERRLADASRRESEIMRRLVDAQESERHRIARDLHDHLGQHMTALRLKIESLVEKSGHNGEYSDVISEVQQRAIRIDRDIGFLSWELRPTELDNLGLVNALGSFVREWSKQHDIDAEFHANFPEDEDEEGRLSRSAETNLYRIVQEGLNNILKHANAKQVSVLLQKRDDSISLIIEDDGIGFAQNENAGDAASPNGLGLIGMQERAALMKGTLEIESRPGEGTTVLARVPYA